MTDSRSGKTRNPQLQQFWRLEHCSGEDHCDVIRPHANYDKAALAMPNYIQSNMLLAKEVSTWSDARLKKDILCISEEDLAKISLLSPKQYKFIDKRDKNKKHFGLIAQEVEKIYPNLILQTSKGKKAVNYLEIIPLLLLKVKDLERQIQELK